MKAFFSIIQREMVLVARNSAQVVNPLLFYFLVALIFPLGLNPEPEVLLVMGPAVCWVGALLATVMSLEQLFRPDYDDGSLEQMLLSPVPAWQLVSAKIATGWLTAGVPVIVVGPIIGLTYGLPYDALPILILSLAIGTPTLALLGSVGVALIVGLRRAGALLSLLILPLFIPVLIFGANSVGAYMEGFDATGPLLMLAAIFFFMLVVCPPLTTAALRVGVNQ